jgi:CRP/FNR family transcriptional regulator, cyclic AMP receptor protein
MMLAQVPLLAGLDAAAIADLEMAATPFAATAGETLFRQGDEATALYILTHGRIGIASRTPGDEEVHVVEAGPGAMVGELGLLDGGRRSATARATSDCSGIAISLARFHGLAAIGRPAAFALADRIRIGVAQRFRATIAAIAAQSAFEEALLRSAAQATLPAGGKAVDLAPMLRGLVRFSGLSETEAAAFVAMGERIDASRHTNIASAGDAPDALYIVLRGAVRTGLPRAGGIEPIAVHGPGEFAGLAAMIDREPFPLTIETVEASILVRIERAAFETLRSQTDELAHRVLDLAGQQLVRDLRRANRHLGRAEALARFRAGGSS